MRSFLVHQDWSSYLDQVSKGRKHRIFRLSSRKQMWPRSIPSSCTTSLFFRHGQRQRVQKDKSRPKWMMDLNCDTCAIHNVDMYRGAYNSDSVVHLGNKMQLGQVKSSCAHFIPVWRWGCRSPFCSSSLTVSFIVRSFPVRQFWRWKHFENLWQGWQDAEDSHKRSSSTVVPVSSPTTSSLCGIRFLHAV